MPAIDENVPLVSVIIPCYRQAHLLGQSVGSALGQTHPRVEIILVDDESPDDTPQVAAGFGEKIRYVRQKNGGVADARNTGLKLARGEFVHFLDADDWLLPQMFEKHLQVMQDSGAAVTASGWHQVNTDGKYVASHEAPIFAPDAFHALLPINLAPPVCYLMKKSAVESINGFDPDRALNGHEDWDLLLRLAGAGFAFATLQAELCAYRDSPGSSSKQSRRMYDTGMFVLAKTARAHGRCDRCERRFSDARQAFYEHYMYKVLKPALQARKTRHDLGSTIRHFLSRSLKDPRLLLFVVRRLAKKAARGASKTMPGSAAHLRQVQE